MKLFKGASGAEKPYYAIATTFAFLGAASITFAKAIDWWFG